jgi:putative ABC transport system permease protein
MFKKKTPLAWHQLMKEKARLLVAIAGITFADMLMFVQLGFQDALYDSASTPHQMLQADLVMISPQFKSLAAVQSFSRDRLYQTLSLNGVESVNSVYIGMSDWKNPETRLNRGILVWGVEPDSHSFALPDVQQNVEQLKLLNHVLYDRAGRPEYGAIADKFQTSGAFTAELNQQSIEVSGLFTMGASFVADGNVITSDSTFLQLFRDRQPHQIDIGLIHLQPNTNIAQVQSQLLTNLPEDIKILTVEEFVNLEKYYWESQGTIGFIFGLGIVVGFIVGIVIVYQILYTDVSNHLPEYATLKAMGYSDRFLLTMLIQEAFLLAILGFIPGYFISIGIYSLTYAATMLPIAMSLQRAVTVLILTLMMCGSSGAIAMRKLRSADPADIF